MGVIRKMLNINSITQCNNFIDINIGEKYKNFMEHTIHKLQNQNLDVR